MKFKVFQIVFLSLIIIGCSKTPKNNLSYKNGFKYLNNNSRVVGNSIYYLDGENLCKVSISETTPQLITKLPRITSSSELHFNDLVFDCDEQSVYYCDYNITTAVTKIKKKNFNNPVSEIEITSINGYVLNMQVNSQNIFGLVKNITGKIFSISKQSNNLTYLITDANSNNLANSFEVDEVNIYYVDQFLNLKQYDLTTSQRLTICKVKEFEPGGTTMKICDHSLLIPFKDGIMSVNIPSQQSDIVPIPIVTGFSYSGFQPSQYLSYPTYFVQGKKIYELVYRKYTNINVSPAIYAVITNIYAINPTNGSVTLIKKLFPEDYLVSGIFGIIETNGKYTIFTDNGTITSDL